MTVLEAMPANPNPLQVNGLRFWCRKLPNVDFYVQRAIIPSVSLPSVKNPNPLVNVSLGGDHIDFGDVTLEWRVDEDAKSLIEVFNWIRGVGFPEDTNQFKQLFDQKPYSGLGLQSEGVLVVLDSKKRANFQYVFRDMSPTTLDTTPYTIEGSGVDYVMATATFNITDYVIESAKYTVDNG